MAVVFDRDYWHYWHYEINKEVNYVREAVASSFFSSKTSDVF